MINDSPFLTQRRDIKTHLSINHDFELCIDSIVLQLLSTGSLEFGSGNAEFGKGRRVEGVMNSEVGMRNSESQSPLKSEVCFGH